MKQKNNRKNRTNEMYNKLKEGVTNIINSNQYVEFLKFSKNFHHYSFNNMVLIYSQMEDATRVAGFKTWEKLGRKIKKGAKGIQIFFPIKRTYSKKITGQTSLNSNSYTNENTESQETIEYFTYRPTYVFDVSQTTGKPVPEPIKVEKLNTNNMTEFFSFLKDFSPYPILDKELSSSLYGYWNKEEKHIVLNANLSIDDKVATLIHELSHALYDDFNYKHDRKLSETFVESVAFIVADYFGLDTSRCSFNYIATWAKEPKIIIDLGAKIQKCANDFINKLENYEFKQIKIVS